MERIESIYKRHVDDLYAYGLHLGFNNSVVMDAIHNVFQKLLINKKLDYKNNTKAYLLKSVRNELLDDYKRSQIHSLYDPNNKSLPFEFEVNVEDAIMDQEDKAFLKSKIQEVLQSLTPRQREIIYLRYTQNYNYQQISEILEITLPACRNLMLKALKHLRKNKMGNFYLFLTCPQH
ncbi:RNA polymerase sigma factor [Gelidibacter maritimus]|uniref:Sigma-70 family RNA polymerase sigma factor n=1 Tax=Gelidibacter maritimus TaxID=2761487 RepID=A0A7W2R315_9FLAO|nr:sigma-70 family RNA polymerase sigma factor [Gelidibacter maritimus]MBA6152381.1 sigma-70 family RNA polymerase sigma factor [Gelidibacter maritimus]